MTLDVKIVCSRGDFRLDVNVQFRQGITALSGPSGAGKSTLLHCIAGLILPDYGRISLGQRTLVETTQGVYVPVHGRRMGLVFQDNRLFPHLSVRGNLAFGQTGPRDKRRAEMEKLIAILQIEPLLNRRVDTLSGGEKKRVALARAILNNPQWLLLDEPFSGLNESLKAQIITYLLRLRQAVSVPMILVSHSQDEIAGLADEVIFLQEGCVTGRGRPGVRAADDSASFGGSLKLDKSRGDTKISNHAVRLRSYRNLEVNPPASGRKAL